MEDQPSAIVIIDGDTLRLNGERIRILNIDARKCRQEQSARRKAIWPWPRGIGSSPCLKSVL